MTPRLDPQEIKRAAIDIAWGVGGALALLIGAILYHLFWRR